MQDPARLHSSPPRYLPAEGRVAYQHQVIAGERRQAAPPSLGTVAEAHEPINRVLTKPVAQPDSATPKPLPCCGGGNETSLLSQGLVANRSMTSPLARFWEATQPQEMPPAHLVGVISLDVPEGAGGRLAEGAAGQRGLQRRLLYQQRLWLRQRRLDDDGGGRGRGAGGSGGLWRRLFLHLHFSVVEILLPLPLVRVCAIPARGGK